MILGKITSLFGCDRRNIGTDKNMKKKKRINGTVVLTKKNVLDFNDFHASVVDGFHEFLGKGVSLQLISLVDHRHTGNKVKERLGKPAFLEWVNTLTSLTTGNSAFNVVFEDEVDEDENGLSCATPGAFIIKNNHGNEFFLETLTLHNVSAGQKGRVHFVCNSWVYPAHNYDYDRVFFSNKTYLPSETPEPLRKYREQELVNLRGNGKGELKEWDRVYDYAYYNDLSDPDKGVNFVRRTLGGSTDFPYPRRGRTGRPPTKTDPAIESRMSLLDSIKVYVPRDERFGHLRMSDFFAYLLKALGQVIKPALNSKFDETPGEFDTFQDVLDIYEGGCPMPTGLIEDVRKNVPPQLLKEIFRTDGERFLKFPMPQVIQASRSAWRSDEEFAREMLAGVNPIVIRRLQEFPPASRLDPKVYGNQTSTITRAHIEHSLDGLTVDEALNSNKLFILDHHDTFMPYLRKINSTATKTYATRTLLFLQNDSTLKPLAIELSLPHLNGDKFGAVSKIYTPAKSGVQATIWELAKAYAAVNDSGFHQLVSHWLYTHAVMEPFVIAANRQLSVVHPIYKLLKPHFRDTMNINAQARQTLINAEGILESTVFPGKYAMEMSAVIYKNWVLTDQGLPQDLIKRGIAVKDPDSPHGLRLLIPDYPFAVDGLEIWSAIQTWVHEYTSHYYTTDEMVRTDPELQSWWTELREVGHGDKRSEPWWPRMQTRRDLAETCTVIIWIASALHAAVNFGQYPYAGYLPNRPTVSRRFMPNPNDPELRAHPERAFLRTITAEAPTLLGVSLIEILSRHASDEVYLGQRVAPDWTDERQSLEAFERFGKRLVEIEEAIMRRNGDEKLKNRAGPVKFPYTLLCPSSGPGITARGIPNSVSI